MSGLRILQQVHSYSSKRSVLASGPLCMQVASLKVFISMTILLALATVILCVPNPRQPSGFREFSRQTPTAQEETYTANYNEPEFPPLATPGGIVEKAPTTQDKETESHYISTDTLYRWYLVATIIGVLGGFIGLRVLYVQTKATKISADAAKGSADSLKAVERPWLLVRYVSATTTVFVPKKGMQVIGVEWDLHNYGRTPALVETIESRIAIVPSDYHFPTLPVYGRPYTVFEKPVVPPGENSHNVINIIDREWGVGEFQQVVNGQLLFFLCGRVSYKDPFKGVHETRFCLKLDLNERINSAVGPEGYNTCT